MTDAPHVPQPVDDWPKWSADKQRALHPDAPQPPTAEELHRYAVAWGHADPVILTDWREWEKRYNDALDIICAMARERDVLDARLSALTLKDHDRVLIHNCTEALELGERLHEYQARALLRIIARLTRANGDVSGEATTNNA